MHFHRSHIKNMLLNVFQLYVDNLILKIFNHFYQHWNIQENKNQKKNTHSESIKT